MLEPDKDVAAPQEHQPHPLTPIRERSIGEGPDRDVELNQGWHRLAADLDKQIATIDPDYRVIQVKEKAAGLRYHVKLSTGLDQEAVRVIHELIRCAEIRSCTICELCGGPGRRGPGRPAWIPRTRCSECPA